MVGYNYISVDAADCPFKDFVGDGICDDLTNIEECNFDGGDCCGCADTSGCSDCICISSGKFCEADYPLDNFENCTPFDYWINYSGDYWIDYSGDFSGDYWGDYSGEYWGDYSGDFSGDYSGDYSDDYW